MVRTKRPPQPQFPTVREPPRLLLVADTTTAFAEAVVASGVDIELAFRADTMERARAKQAAWAAKGMESVIVKLLSVGHVAYEEGNENV